MGFFFISLMFQKGSILHLVKGLNRGLYTILCWYKHFWSFTDVLCI